MLNPVAVMGPVMGPSISGSNEAILSMLTGRMPVMANVALPIVDVRDVAAAHVAAVGAPGAEGRRFLLADGYPAIPLPEIAALLREELPAASGKVPTRRLPDALVRLHAPVVPAMRGIAPDLGRIKKPAIDSAREILGFAPRPAREAILAAARSMVDAGLVEVD